MTKEFVQAAPSPLHLESFREIHQGHLNPDLLMESGREALAHHHLSPVPLRIAGNGISAQTRSLHFDQPDPRTKATVQRERIVEDGAVVMAGVVLSLNGLRILRATRRRSFVDYVVAAIGSDEPLGVVEISGTDHDSIGGRSTKKLRQAGQSYLVRPPHSLRGWIAVTRFVDPQCRLDLLDSKGNP